MGAKSDMTKEGPGDTLESILARLEALESRARSKDSINNLQAVLRTLGAILVVSGMVALTHEGIAIPDILGEVALTVVTLFLVGDAGLKFIAARSRRNGQ